MAVDLVCGKDVDPSTFFKTKYGDRPFYFCSYSCEMNFARNPLRYLDKTHSVAMHPGAPVLTADGEVHPSRA